MCEYMNRGIFDTAKKYGKDIFLSIKHIGTKRLPRLYAFKSSLEYYLNKIPFVPKFLPDQILYYLSRLFPEHLPNRLLDFRDRFEHYLILVMSDEVSMKLVITLNPNGVRWMVPISLNAVNLSRKLR